MKNLKFRVWDKNLNQMDNHEFCLVSCNKSFVPFDVYSKSSEIETLQSLLKENSNSQNSEHYFNQVLPHSQADWYMFDRADFYGADSYIVMQYSGIKDNKEQELYEGDLIVWSKYEPDLESLKTQISVIVFRFGRFCVDIIRQNENSYSQYVKDFDKYGLRFSNGGYLGLAKKIGNIFETKNEIAKKFGESIL